MNGPDRLALLLARVGPAGLSPKAPGTCGSAVATLLAPFVFLPLPFLWRAVLLAILFVFGAWAAGRAEDSLGCKDPGEVVIDEVLGQWIAMLPFAGLAYWEMALAFAMFRFFDILKPWPVKASETWLPGGWGVMLDDALAGVYAFLCLWLARLF